MTTFTIHNKDTAPDNALPLLEGVEQAFGFIPNLIGMAAESPAVAEAYLNLGQLFDKTSLSATERQVAILAISRYNECHYCIAAHSVIASLQKVPTEIVDAIRNDEPIFDSRLEALRHFATLVVKNRGWVVDEDIEAFLKAGFTKAQVLEVVLAVSYKTLSNYLNHITDMPLDDAFATRAWQPKTETEGQVA